LQPVFVLTGEFGQTNPFAQASVFQSSGSLELYEPSAGYRLLEKTTKNEYFTNTAVVAMG
jgi:hypothetical protein